MKKIFFIFVLVSCFAAGFAQTSNYNSDDLFNYFMNAPDSKLPPEGEKVKIEGGFLSVEDINIDGNGMDYLVKSVTLKLYGQFSKLIYIYSENIKTKKSIGDGYWPTVITIPHDIEIVYTGKTAPAINGEGNRVEVPIFIAY